MSSTEMVWTWTDAEDGERRRPEGGDDGCLHQRLRSQSLQGGLNVPKLPQNIFFLNESEFSG